jgi:hypothetical protein
MMAAMHGIHSHGQFFLHTKGGEECNWRHVSQKQSKEEACQPETIERNGDISSATGAFLPESPYG